MIILFYGFGVLLAVSAVVIVYASLTAQDGYEDQSGFHFIRTNPDSADHAGKKAVGDNLPPFAPAS